MMYTKSTIVINSVWWGYKISKEKYEDIKIDILTESDSILRHNLEESEKALAQMNMKINEKKTKTMSIDREKHLV